MRVQLDVVARLILTVGICSLVASAVEAQNEPCNLAASASPVELRKCVESLQKRLKSDSIASEQQRARVDSIAAANVQLRLLIEEITRRLPPEGKTVAEYLSSQGLVADSAGAFRVNGDVILNGRLCIPDECIDDAGEQIQIRSQRAAGILFQANRDGTWYQSPCAGISSLLMAPDLGLRLIQNQRWTVSGEQLDFICRDIPMGSVGFDSQAEWSFNGLKPGRTALGTQRLVLRTDEDTKTVYFATWAPGWKIEFRSSGETCKWCENLRWKVPYQ